MEMSADLIGLSADAKLLLRPSPEDRLRKSADLRKILASMIVRASKSRIKERLIDELEPFQAYMINACRNFGVHIALLGRREKISDLRIHETALSLPDDRIPDGRLTDTIRGFYYADRKLLVIGEEQIGMPDRLVSVHEFAHAYDHTFSEKHYQSHYLSTQLWERFSGSRKAAISDYAATAPEEYFAECVEGYFFPKGAAWLKANDPEMYEFLGTLFL